jgi:hypothetical protein
MTTYAVIDHATHNILGEYSNPKEAEALVERLVASDGSVRGDLAIHEVEATAPDLAASVTVA